MGDTRKRAAGSLPGRIARALAGLIGRLRGPKLVPAPVRAGGGRRSPHAGRDPR